MKPFEGTLRVQARPETSDQRLEASLVLRWGDPRDEAYTASPKAIYEKDVVNSGDAFFYDEPNF